MSDRFVFESLRMGHVTRDEKKAIPENFEDRCKPIDPGAFHRLLLEKRKVFVVAGAGAGKTTFLRHLQLELLQQRLSEAPLPIFDDIDHRARQQATLLDRVADSLQKAGALDFSPEKAARVAGALHHNGRLCFLMDALDQCGMDGFCKNLFQGDASGVFAGRRVVVACRKERVAERFRFFRDVFHAWEWVVLEGFDEDRLVRYLGPETYLRRTNQPIHLSARI